MWAVLYDDGTSLTTVSEPIARSLAEAERQRGHRVTIRRLDDPESAPEPEPIRRAERFARPEPISEPEPAPAPEPVQKVEPAQTVEPTLAPEPAQIVEPAQTVEPTLAPEPAQAVEPARCPRRTANPSRAVRPGLREAAGSCSTRSPPAASSSRPRWPITGMRCPEWVPRPAPARRRSAALPLVRS